MRKYAIGEGALSLWAALPYVPVGAHVAVVDPGVGTARRPVALRVGRGDVLVGPDNGLLVPAAERLGGIVEARELANADVPIAGRDVDLPRPRHLRAGGRAPRRRRPVRARSARRSTRRRSSRRRCRRPRSSTAALATEIVYVDTFGNVKLSAPSTTSVVAALGEPVGRGSG